MTCEQILESDSFVENNVTKLDIKIFIKLIIRYVLGKLKLVIS